MNVQLVVLQKEMIDVLAVIKIVFENQTNVKPFLIYAFFQFGGKLISFGNEIQQQQQLQQGVTQQRLIYISQVVTEPELISRSTELETALQYGQYLEFCRNKIANSTTPHERAVWSFLRANFEPNPRIELLELLGFKQDDLSQKVGLQFLATVKFLKLSHIVVTCYKLKTHMQFKYLSQIKTIKST